MSKSDQNGAGIQVIARAAAILRVLKNERAGLSLGEIAKRVDLPRSTVQRIVGALQSEHLVIAASPERGIRLGPELVSLAQAGKIEITDIFKPYLLDLSKRTGETVDLAVMRGRELIFLDQISGSHRLRTISVVGESFPLFNTANGKACLALLDNRSVTRVVAPDFGADSEEKLSLLLTELADVRAKGMAFDLDEHTMGISAVGGAVADINGDIYAISIPTPSARFAEQRELIVSELARTLEAFSSLPVVAKR